ncbi:MAG: hypothetical protein HOQ03_06055 [Thermoleophilia bacterium]|nr:hypothetical protein [Thermoleophilia bacterium]
MKKLLLVLAVALVAVPAATAGGWATVGRSSLPPAGLGPKEKWPVDITVLQHGMTPLAGVTPVVRVRDDGGRVVDTFRATPTGKTGVYHADVTFPARGEYSYEVYDGFETYGGARTHTFKPITIGAGDSGFPYGWLATALGAALALAAATVLALRRRTPEPQPVHLKEAA